MGSLAPPGAGIRLEGWVPKKFHIADGRFEASATARFVWFQPAARSEFPQGISSIPGVFRSLERESPFRITTMLMPVRLRPRDGCATPRWASGSPTA